jgi:hypothetical protein
MAWRTPTDAEIAALVGPRIDVARTLGAAGRREAAA